MNKLYAATLLVILVVIGESFAHICTVRITPPSPQTICPGTQQTFQCQGLDAPQAVVTWKLGTTVVSSGTGSALLTVTYDQLTAPVRIYTCTVTAIDCQDSATLVVNRGSNPDITITPAFSQPVCGEERATFRCSSPSATVQFRLVGGSFVGTPASGTVTITLGVADISQRYECVATKAGCTSVSPPVQVVAGTPPVVTVTPDSPQTVCGSQTVKFICRATEGATVQFKQVGGPFVGTPRTTTVKLVLGTENIGEKYICVAKLGECVAFSSPVKVVLGTVATPTISSSPARVCYPLTCATLTCHSNVAGVRYTFYRDDTPIAVNQVSNTLKVCPSTATSYTCSVAKGECVSDQSAPTTVQVTNVACSAGNSPPHKVNICHFPGQKGNNKSQCIAIEGFLNGHCPHHPTDYATPSETCGLTAPNPECSCSAILAARETGNCP